jgi:protein-S-isoprenylcysteine O-methyltransferase Ste14
MIKIKIPPPIQTLIAAFLMASLDKLLKISVFESDLVLVAIIICCILASTFLIFALIGFINVKTTVNPLKPETTTSLVTSGVYKYSRNPMYAGMALFLFAWFLWLANPLNILIFVIYITYITQLQIKPEERALSKIFGEQFDLYCKNVRRWI